MGMMMDKELLKGDILCPSLILLEGAHSTQNLEGSRKLGFSKIHYKLSHWHGSGGTT